MSKYKGYDEKSKLRTTRYMKEKRDSLNLNFPKGYKDTLRALAQVRGYTSISAMMMALVDTMTDAEKEAVEDIKKASV